MKNTIIRAGVLTVVFIVALIVSSMITNKDTVDITTVMSEATLPTISFETEGYGVNHLVGYVREMEIPTMRDTITPLDKEGKVKLHIHNEGNTVRKATYQVYSMDGQHLLMEKTEAVEGESLTLEPGSVLDGDVEAVLCVSLDVAEQDTIYYYTRIVRPEEYHVKECLDFTKKLHNHMMDKDKDTMALYMEPDANADMGTLQHVTISSSVDQATWGAIKPKIEGEVLWDIKETNETYTSVVLKYRVSGKEDDQTSVYNVQEFFKVRKLGNKFYLLVYDRTMDELFDVDKSVLTSKGVDLGVSTGKEQYMVGKEGTLVAFVLQRELWMYDLAEDSLSQVFSFKSTESGEDDRDEYNQHNIRIVSMDKEGNLTFVVYGYMNRGSHEGEVGAAVYCYHHKYNTLKEKAFLASRKSYEVAAKELFRMVYYNEPQDRLYFMMEGDLCCISTVDGSETRIATDLTEEKYVFSESGGFIAYQNVDEALGTAEIIVLDMAKGTSHSILSLGEESIRPLGFIGEDFVYGTLRPTDKGKTVAGMPTTPMYRIDICNEKYEVVKTYQEKGIYISGILTDENMLTLRRVKKNGKKYREISEEYITNNEEVVSNNISLSAYSSAEGRQYMLSFEDGIEDKKPKILRPKQILVDNIYTKEFKNDVSENRYYVYGIGKLVGVYNHAGEALLEADAKEGVVVSGHQTYVWERGNYDAWHQIYELRGKRKKAKETTLDACIRIAGEYEGMENGSHTAKEPLAALAEMTGGEALDLSGCKTSDLCYMISQGTPIIAMTGEGDAVLLVGYYNNTIVYLDPADGVTRTCSYKAMDEKTKESGYTYFGYAKTPFVR